MVSPKFMLAALLPHIILFFPPAEAARLFNRGGDLANVTPLSVSGYTVPLEGGLTCRGRGNCISSLPPPAGNRTLQVLAIGRGILNYTCANVEPVNAPVYDDQYTQLFDAAPLIPLVPNEASFHALIPDFLNYNYSDMDNSTLRCIGSIGTLDSTAVITIFDVDTFQAYVEESVNPPGDTQNNGVWVHSRSADDKWDVYRVETAGGAIPATCQSENSTVQVDYAAEYWLYHA